MPEGRLTTRIWPGMPQADPMMMHTLCFFTSQATTASSSSHPAQRGRWQRGRGGAIAAAVSEDLGVGGRRFRAKSLHTVPRLQQMLKHILLTPQLVAQRSMMAQ